VEAVAVGEADRVKIPALRTRRSEERLSGLRCIHTHPGGMAQLSHVDIQSLRALRLDAMAAIGVGDGGIITGMQVGILSSDSNSTCVDLQRVGFENHPVNLFGPYCMDTIPDDLLWAEIEAADEAIRPDTAKKSAKEIARAILVGLGDDEAILRELADLTDTAGFITVGRLTQPRSKPDRTYYLGHGKLQELQLEIQRLQADAVIFDDELTPSQIRNIQRELGKKIEVIDRTALILDIFSGRASTHEGRLQVELAQAKYLLPRMAGYWGHFTRMAGGGGGGGGARRGEGETQLEVDRRLLRKRVTELEREIDKIKGRRDVARAQRKRNAIPVVALVGYTNAGKSTLMNRLSGSSVLAEDKLFATLDPVARKINYGGGEFLLVDTVGFIDKLPHDLINAFRATLEEARHADVLLHVVDASSPKRGAQMDVVQDVLRELKADQNPTVIVYNKCDLVSNGTAKFTGGDAVAISAATGAGIEAVTGAISAKFAEMRTEITAVLPTTAGALLSRLYENGQVHSCDYREDGIHITATVTREDEERIKSAQIA
jgi:GTP-binding protein HflX